MEWNVYTAYVATTGMTLGWIDRTDRSIDGYMRSPVRVQPRCTPLLSPWLHHCIIANPVASILQNKTIAAAGSSIDPRCPSV